MDTQMHFSSREEQICRLALAEFSDRARLTGVDLGYKYEDRQRRPEISLRFHVDEKKEPEQLSKDEKLLPGEFEGFETDVIEAPLKLAASKPPKDLAERRKRRNPIVPGISVSHAVQGAGTLGAIVYRNSDGAPAILSCWHVLGYERARKGDPIYQPSPVDGGDLRFDVVGYLEDWVKDADGDAAIALLNLSRMVRRVQFGTDDVVLTSARQVRIGEILSKSGRGTGVTRARVDGIGRYRLPIPGLERIEVDGFKLVPVDGGEISSTGDSGAVWYATEPGGVIQGVGLHFFGELTQDEPEAAYACHLPRVLDRLNVSLQPMVAAAADTVLKGAVIEDPAEAPISERTAAALLKSNEEILKQVTALVEARGNGPAAQAGNGGDGYEVPLVATIASASSHPKNGKSRRPGAR